MNSIAQLPGAAIPLKYDFGIEKPSRVTEPDPLRRSPSERVHINAAPERRNSEK